jgi:hypothetical protein
MDYIDAEDGSIAIFDPETGDAHFLDQAGSDILRLLAEEISFGDLVKRLREIYDAPEGVIERDTEELLAELLEKKVVVRL